MVGTKGVKAIISLKYSVRNVFMNGRHGLKDRPYCFSTYSLDWVSMTITSPALMKRGTFTVISLSKRASLKVPAIPLEGGSHSMAEKVILTGRVTLTGVPAWLETVRAVSFFRKGMASSRISA